jgi:protein-tyrosine phosphatase
MVDIHSHVLPLVDDGPASWELAIEMCRMSHRDGVTDLVATPHANDRYEYDRDKHLERIDILQRHVPEINLWLGCDFHLSFDNVRDALRNPAKYTIGKTRYLLIEFSEFGVPKTMLTPISELHNIGITTIISHPERNPSLGQKLGFLKELAKMGCIVQVTANSITGFWGKAVQKISESMLKGGIVDVIATDAHDVNRRTPILSEARDRASQLVGGEMAYRLVEENPRRIIQDEPILINQC